ncbi:MAG: AMP-binding protein [Pigmentiphaga sp.]
MARCVYDVFAATATVAPDADFLYVESVTAEAYGISPGSISWREAKAHVEALRGIYRAAGYGHGHRVALQLENRPEFIFHWLALNALGASIVPVGSDVRAAELEHLIEHSQVSLAVTLSSHTQLFADAAVAVGACLVVVEPAIDEGLFAQAGPAPRAGQTIDSQTECALLYTSGTTGRPKGCILSNDYFIRAGQWYAGLDDLCEVRPGKERILTPLPLNHSNALVYSTMVTLTAGGCLIQLDRFHPSTFWQSVKESGATIVHYLGILPALLLAKEASTQDREHQVRWGFGAGVAPEYHADFETRFGFPLIEAWAMTETGAGSVVMANHEPRHVGTHCFGKPTSDIEWRLVSEEGDDVELGQPGELWVRQSGPDPRKHFFSGYLGDVEATEVAWEGDWFHTGDVVRADAAGSLYFVDRRKNIIRRSGENISAIEVETEVNSHPAVKLSGITAVPDQVRGDEVMACVVTNDLVPPEEFPRIAQSIVEFCLGRLAYYKAPGYIAFVDRLPLTSSQKIQRGKLRTFAAGLLSDARCVDTRELKKRR